MKLPITVTNSMGESQVVYGSISDFSGCDQIGISHSVFTKDKKKGFGKLAHEKRLEKMKDLGYDYAMCTVVIGNDIQEHILKSFGWIVLDSFLSSKTGNTVNIYGKNLQ
jgi:hypothetical protein